MIAWVEGVLRDKTPMRLVVDVSGVGYELSISLTTFSQLPDAGKTVALPVQTVAREDALLLYGFATRHEKSVFELLLRANRVGPRLAQTILRCRQRNTFPLSVYSLSGTPRTRIAS